MAKVKDIADTILVSHQVTELIKGEISFVYVT